MTNPKLESTSHQVHALGMMSGSSLDGLDLAFCRFCFSAEGVLDDWSLLATKEVPFGEPWYNRLRGLPGAGGLELIQAHVDFGHYLGEKLLPFLQELAPRPDLIASHGHTVFHYPDRRMTWQIGDGAAIAAVTGCTTIDNFRAMDLALGGQGAPLAPLADKMLFPGFDFYLNLGGIANISARTESGFVAFDIGGANQVLNALAAKLGKDFDAGGKIAATGALLPGLLQKADALPYFRQPYPKSLGNDWVLEQLIPLFLQYEGRISDKLHTAVIHLARQVAGSIRMILQQEGTDKAAYRLLVTGGGAFNDFLVEQIQLECRKVIPLTVTVPEAATVAFKEAALMALMGALRFHNRPNCLASVTGARYDAIGGAVHRPETKEISRQAVAPRGKTKHQPFE